MAKWVRAGVLDDGLNDIKNTATKMLLIEGYTPGDSYATVVAAKIAEATMTGTDFTLGSSGDNRTLSVAAGKQGTATATTGGAPDLHIAFTDGTANVIWVTDETSDQVVTSGNTVNFPSGLVYTAQQPT